MEYDRQGYRFDGAAGLFQSGGITDRSTKQGDYYIFGLAAGAASVDGGGFFATGAAGLYDPAVTSVINQGTLKVDSAGVVAGKVYNTWAGGGVAEADCLMCHLNAQYQNQQRNYAFPAATAPKLAASFGLHGIKSTVNNAANGNPNPASWSWNGTGFVSLTADEIVKTPKRENCALCHFPDGSNSTLGSSGKKLGFTAFQKKMLAGEAADSDEIIGVNGKDGKNDTDWDAVKGRVEGGKRAESINVGFNPDAHMDATRGNMGCSVCHYTLEGSFPALMSGTNEIQPAVTVYKIDHQFAKGNNAPDGKNMDQLDNTATCASCHITGTHPNASGAPSPATAHAGFPALHFDKIDCKTCHIPVLNAPMKQDVADYSAGPWRTFERGQATESPTGVNRKPLYMWRATEHDGSGLQIEPIMTMAVPVWVNGSAWNADNSVATFTPTFQRAAKKGAEQLRAYYGDGNADGVYDFKLNDATDKYLIINTQTEITDMITQLRGAGISIAEPVLSFYFNQFATSHNVLPKAAQTATKAILGSPTGGGCVMCHSSSNPANVSYSPNSVGFFDKTHTIFPTPAGGALVQTVVDGKLRVNAKFAVKKPDGSSGSINLAGTTAGTAMVNTLSQGEVLGYTSDQLGTFTNCALCHTGKSMASLSHPTGSGTPAACTTCHIEKHQTAVVVATTCGQCHGGDSGATSNGAPRIGDAALAAYAQGMHDKGIPAPATPPTASFTLTPVSGTTTTLADTSSFDQNATTKKVTVNWGDGTIGVITAGTSTTHTYNTTRVRSYPVTLTASDGMNPLSKAYARVNVPQRLTAGGNTTANARVTLRVNDHARKVVTASSSGRFDFSNIPSGSHVVIRVYASGTTTDHDLGTYTTSDNNLSF